MSRDAAIAHARRHLDSGGLVAELTRRIAVPSTSQEPERAAALPARALERGVIVNVTAGRVVRLFPALTIPESDLFEGVERVLALAAD